MAEQTPTKVAPWYVPKVDNASGIPEGVSLSIYDEEYQFKIEGSVRGSKAIQESVETTAQILGKRVYSFSPQRIALHDIIVTLLTQYQFEGEKEFQETVKRVYEQVVKPVVDRKTKQLHVIAESIYRGVQQSVRDGQTVSNFVDDNGDSHEINIQALRDTLATKLAEFKTELSHINQDDDRLDETERKRKDKLEKLINAIQESESEIIIDYLADQEIQSYFHQQMTDVLHGTGENAGLINEESVKRPKLSQSTADARRTFLVVGGAASGKSGITETIRSSLERRTDVMELNPDALRELLLPFEKVGEHVLLHGSLSNMESGYVFDRAIERWAHMAEEGLAPNIIMDVQRAGEWQRDMLASGGSRLAEIHTPIVDTEITLQRSYDRGKKTGRFVPTELLVNGHADQVPLNLAAMRAGHPATFYINQGIGEPPLPIAHYDAGHNTLRVSSLSDFYIYLKKAALNPGVERAQDLHRNLDQSIAKALGDYVSVAPIEWIAKDSQIIARISLAPDTGRVRLDVVNPKLFHEQMAEPNQDILRVFSCANVEMPEGIVLPPVAAPIPDLYQPASMEGEVLHDFNAYVDAVGKLIREGREVKKATNIYAHEVDESFTNGVCVKLRNLDSGKASSEYRYNPSRGSKNNIIIIDPMVHNTPESREIVIHILKETGEFSKESVESFFKNRNPKELSEHEASVLRRAGMGVRLGNKSTVLGSADEVADYINPDGNKEASGCSLLQPNPDPYARRIFVSNTSSNALVIPVSYNSKSYRIEPKGSLVVRKRHFEALAEAYQHYQQTLAETGKGDISGLIKVMDVEVDQPDGSKKIEQHAKAQIDVYGTDPYSIEDNYCFVPSTDHDLRTLVRSVLDHGKEFKRTSKEGTQTYVAIHLARQVKEGEHRLALPKAGGAVPVNASDWLVIPKEKIAEVEYLLDKSASLTDAGGEFLVPMAMYSDAAFGKMFESFGPSRSEQGTKSSLVITGKETLAQFLAAIEGRSPREIDVALRAAGKDNFYPTGDFQKKVLMPIKDGRITDEDAIEIAKALGKEYSEELRPEIMAHLRRADNRLVQAGALSASLRKEQLMMRRTKTKDGSFCSLIVVPDPNNPEESIAIRNVRGAVVGGGFGAFGGFIEPGDKGDYRPRRELIEELSELAATDDQKAFIKELAAKMEFRPMFTVRDDQHAIDRGWGFVVDAHAHVGMVPPEMRDRALVMLRQLSQQKSSGHEVKKALISRVKDMPGMLANYHYKHEALADVIATQIMIEEAQTAAGIACTYDAWNELEKSNPKSLDVIAQKMHLRRPDVRAIYDETLYDLRLERQRQPGAKPLIEVSNSMYRRAYVETTGLPMPVHYEQIDFSRDCTTLVRSCAPKFIVPLPDLTKHAKKDSRLFKMFREKSDEQAAGVEMRYPAGHPKAGEWVPGMESKRGFLFMNRAESLVTAPADGTLTLVVNDPTPQQAELMERVLKKIGNGKSPKQFSYKEMKAWIDFVMTAGPLNPDLAVLTGETSGLGLTDVFQQRVSSVESKLTDGTLKSKTKSAKDYMEFGGYADQVGKPVAGVYIPENIVFYGTSQAADGKQNHPRGALVVKEVTEKETKYRSIDVGEGLAQQTYRLEDMKPLVLSGPGRNVRLAQYHDIDGTAPEFLENLAATRHETVEAWAREGKPDVYPHDYVPGTSVTGVTLQMHAEIRPQAIGAYLSSDMFDQVASVVKEAGKYANDQQESVVQETKSGSTADLKHDGSSVTRVDHHNSKVMAEKLQQITGYEVLSEEDTDHHAKLKAAEASGKPIWIIDPLDGTLSYSEGYKEFAVTASLLVPDGKGSMTPLAGFVSIPGEQIFMHSGKDGKAVLERAAKPEEAAQPRSEPANKGRLAVAVGWRNGDDAMPEALPVNSRAVSVDQFTLPLRLAKTIMGEKDISLLSQDGIKIWDTAALHAVAKAAGVEFYAYDAQRGTLTGKPLHYGSDTAANHNHKPLENPAFICATPGMMQQIGLLQSPDKAVASR